MTKSQRSFMQLVLDTAFVRFVLLIILTIFGAEILIMALTYFRSSFPTWLDNLIFNPIFLVFFLSPFTDSGSELSFVVFNPTLFAIFLLPVVYLFLFRPWVEREAQRKKAEDMRIEKERIEYAHKIKNQFIANMSHELRTHLNSIIGFSELMKEKRTDELNSKQSTYVNNIYSSANMLLAIISDLLDLSKIQTGKVEIVVEKISVPETINENIDLIQEKAAKKNVLFKKDLDPALEQIEADKQIFNQIFFNLLDNAVKFSKDTGGIVTVTTKKEDDMAKISVRDTGVGIREEDMTKLFSEFLHIESGLNRKPDGTGLGLVISKNLVEMCGGNIRAQSEFGEGSTFTFLIPLKFEKKA
ncbi:MAG: HAMP domain-containing sensor histidine kinase [Candidatus Methanoperedens sp.]|nr:HAMP domain-containing sensor histidine kinase [Candidatus Methanoperedens sp.]